MNFDQVRFGLYLMLLIVISSCTNNISTSAPADSNKKNISSIFNVEWKVVYSSTASGSTNYWIETNSGVVSYDTWIYLSNQIIHSKYTNSVISNVLTNYVNIFEDAAKQAIVYFTINEYSNEYFIGFTTASYVLSDSSLDITNVLFIGTNTKDSTRTTNVYLVGGNSGIKNNYSIKK